MNGFKGYSKKYAIEANNIVYKDKMFSKKEISILEENGIEKESKYLKIVNESTKQENENKDDERMVTLKQFQEKITNKEFSKNEFNKAYIIEDINIGAKWNEDGTLTLGEKWSPITVIPTGTVLDGCNKKIEGIYINKDQNQAFIRENYGKIKNIIIGKNCYFKTQVGKLSSLLVFNKKGAIVENCVNNADVISEKEGELLFFVSGLILSNSSKVLNCKNYGNVYANKYYGNGYYLGGICAYIESDESEIRGCTNYGNVLGYNRSDGYLVGGIVGGPYNSNIPSFGKIIRCINYGNVESGYASGIISSASVSGEIYDCVNYGKISACNRAAGIIENIGSSGKMVNCYNLGDIYSRTSIYGKPYGGLVVENKGNISSSYNVGKCYLGNNYKGCQIYFENEGNIENTYFLNQTLDDGTVVTSEFMKSDDFLKMLGEGFTKSSLGENNGYPMLRWQKK